jgi:hypothetical protein
MVKRRFLLRSVQIATFQPGLQERVFIISVEGIAWVVIDLVGRSCCADSLPVNFDVGIGDDSAGNFTAS